jgi:alpha-amylase
MEGTLDLPVPPMFYADHVSVSLNSVPRVITDRYALPKGADVNACNVTAQTWCGGTWRTIQDNLDYIQGAGFTASEFIPL